MIIKIIRKNESSFQRNSLSKVAILSKKSLQCIARLLIMKEHVITHTFICLWYIQKVKYRVHFVHQQTLRKHLLDVIKSNSNCGARGIYMRKWLYTHLISISSHIIIIPVLSWVLNWHIKPAAIRQLRLSNRDLSLKLRHGKWTFLFATDRPSHFKSIYVFGNPFTSRDSNCVCVSSLFTRTAAVW